MHEMSLCEGVLRIVQEQAKLQNFSRVRKVWLEIGEFSCAVPDSMALCFEAITAGTLADGATLEMINVPGKGRCRKCAAEFAMNKRYDACPECGAFGIEVVEGGAMRVKELEVD